MADNLRLKLLLEATDGISSVIKSATRTSDKEFERLQKRMDKTAETFDKFGKKSLVLGAGLTATAGIVVNKSMEAGDRIDKMSQMIGMNRKAFQEWDYIMSQNGGNVENLQMGFKTLAEQMNNVQKGSKESIQIFKSLGVAVKDSNGNFRNQSDVFNDTIRALQQIENPTKKAILGNKMFGRSFLEMKPLLNQTAESVDNLRKKANSMNMILSDSDIDTAVKLKDSVDTLQRTFYAFGNQLGISLMPILNRATDKIADFTKLAAQMPQPLKSAIAIGVAGTGLLLTGLGTTSILIGSSIRGFKDMMSVYREASVWLWAHNIKMNNIQLDMRKGFTNGFNLFKSGFGSVKSGIVNFIPNCKNATLSMIAFTKSAPSMFWKGLNNGLNTIKNGFINFIPNCKKAIAAMRSFNIVMSLNPIGLITAGIIAGGFLIYKFWKPIAAFFKGFYLGLKEGLAPLSPMFDKIAKAFKPLANGIKSFFTPINTDGKKALEWGKAFGSFVADIINKLIKACEWAKNLVTFGGKLNFGGKNEPQKIDGSHANGLDRVPKDGYIAQLHKGETVLTASESNKWHKLKQGNVSSSVVYNDNSVFNFASDTSKDNFMQALNQHKKEILYMIEILLKRKQKLSYDY